ncbi:MAG: CoA-binding protein [Ignavibacteriales bacterium]|nr:CoA-binding protein [Ignavibacteriales bacterium]
MNYQEKVNDFLSQKIIAIAGVSRNPKGEVGNPIYKKFKSAGYTVYPINPFADQIEGDKCYPKLSNTPKKPDAVFIATNPSASVDIVKQCIENGITRIWFHRAFGNGSFSEEAAKLGEENRFTVIRSGCPMMFIKDADFFHKLIGFFMKVFGKLS